MRSFITVERFMHDYSISPENVKYLMKHYGIIPFKFGLQTLVCVNDIHMHISNEVAHAEMKANQYEAPKKFKKR